MEALNGEGVDVFVQLKILRQFKRAQMKCVFDVDLLSRLQPFDRLGYVGQLGIVQRDIAEFFLKFQQIVCLQLINIPIHESFKLGRPTCTHRRQALPFFDSLANFNVGSAFPFKRVVNE